MGKKKRRKITKLWSCVFWLFSCEMLESVSSLGLEKLLKSNNLRRKHHFLIELVSANRHNAACEELWVGITWLQRPKKVVSQLIGFSSLCVLCVLMYTLFFYLPQPPLPEEDYPSDNYPAANQPEAFEELLATGPPTLPKEYTLGHVSRTIIPRANLDRSTPAGWHLTVEPNGTWVFTSEHSPDQVTRRLEW